MMFRIVIGIVMVLHGLVHLLYFGQSQRFFELQPGLVWPAGSWAFSRLLGDGGSRLLANTACLMAAAGFVVGGIEIWGRWAWWRPVIVTTAVFSTLLFLLFWDGKFDRLDDKGGVGILINLVILAALLIWQWPRFEF